VRRQNIKALTLAEIIIVVLILGVLAAVALPRYQITVEKVIASEGVQTLKVLFDAQKRYFMETGTYKSGSGGSGNPDCPPGTDSSQICPGDLDVYIPDTKYFTAAYLYNGDPLAIVYRINNGDVPYLLQVSPNGDTSCAEVNAPAGYCDKLGF